MRLTHEGRVVRKGLIRIVATLSGAAGRDPTNQDIE